MTCFGAEGLGPRRAEPFMGKPAPVGGGVLSIIRVTMMIMRVCVVELLCQEVMGRAPVSMSLVPSVHGCLWLRPIM
jgi:hypothetical protein